MKKELPSGWNEKTIGEIFQFIKNYSNSRAELNDYDEISYIHYGDIHKYYRHRIECDKVDFPKISAEKLSKDINKISYAKNGDLIVVDASEDYEGTCISAEIKNLNYKLVSGLHTFLLRDENKIFADGYRGYIFYNHDVHIQCCKVATGISVYGISQENLKNIKIMIPPLDEQKRIAEILSTFDDLIENLNKLIEKKELYKKGIMQRVLTGKVRFDGFTDEWEFTTLDKIIVEKSIRNKDNKINLVLSVTNKEGFVIQNEFFGKTIASKDLSNYKIVDKYDFAYNPARVNVGSISMLENFDSCIVSPMYVVFSLNKLKIDKYFFKYWIQSNNFNGHIRSLSAGSVRSILSFDAMSTMKIKLPSLEEQNKIAELLSLIDKDIDNLKKMLQLRKLQKKGVMQKLLTGEVRV